jgi:hypothetical protein
MKCTLSVCGGSRGSEGNGPLRRASAPEGGNDGSGRNEEMEEMEETDASALAVLPAPSKGRPDHSLLVSSFAFAFASKFTSNHTFGQNKHNATQVGRSISGGHNQV